MFRQRIHIQKYDWDVTVFYESDRWNASTILRELNNIGVDDKTYFLASENLKGGYMDTGLTYTNMDARKSVIVLSKTSSKAEFANTWFHEVIHCAVHIARANGLDFEGEPMAYVGGELARSMQPVAARLMCPTCKDT